MLQNAEESAKTVNIPTSKLVKFLERNRSDLTVIRSALAGEIEIDKLHHILGTVRKWDTATKNRVLQLMDLL